MANPSKLLVVKQDLQILKDQVAQLIGGPQGQQIANTLELYIGKSVEAILLEFTPGILRPFVGGVEQKLGDELIADTQKATDAGLSSLAANNPVPVAK